MVYSYTPTYYSTLHDSITSLCKTILPFSFKKRRLPALEHRLSKLQSDNLKWQQDSFHQILNLMGLHKEGILGEAEVAAFRTHLLETLIASPPELEQPVILRDKLVFLQELLYAKCISEEEYHSSKRPLLQRLAVQGAEIEASDVIVANPKGTKENQEEEWSVIDLKDENCSTNRDNLLHSKNKSKNNPTMKQIKGAASVFGFGSSQKPSKNRSEKSIFDVDSNSSAYMVGSKENPFWDSHMKGKENETKSILMQEEILPTESMKENGSGTDKAKRKPFRTLFHREQREGHGGGGGDYGPGSEEKASKSAKKQWGFDGFKKWKRSDLEDETAPLPLNERSDSEAFVGSCQLVTTPIGEGPDTKQIKKKLHANGAPSDFFIDKVLGDKIKKELSRIQMELSTTNPNLKFSNDQMEAISTTLPVDKADLKKFFPKSWCDRYGDVVLDVVKKEFKDHVGEMENMRNATREKHHNNSMRWTTFEDDENCHPNLFANNHTSGYTDNKNNPFSYDYTDSKLRPESAFCQDQNPFWNPRNGSSLLG
ncbi:Uveal autoantigen with coiled-coil domains and ankyrin repeats isoform 1 [Theobroma cacao]|uniref:Uveal autoantigen with coiled-coil domains and ankyrin repeats isoform 1 n=1 Tax=Theobroma cacao TaxID=3641 RepID=A0A061GPH6_THECC|nr:Uveal autoantigen with coiled-coil domains and ankyrin repeats isoform 1 [Theobroma cacao]